MFHDRKTDTIATRIGIIIFIHILGRFLERNTDKTVEIIIMTLQNLDEKSLALKLFTITFPVLSTVGQPHPKTFTKTLELRIEYGKNNTRYSNSGEKALMIFFILPPLSV